jgi:release factor glutamine methyltransferase
MLDVRSALREGISRLGQANVPSHALAAELLLMHTLGRDRAWVYAHPERAVEGPDADRYFALIARRVAGEPTQYLTGKQEFWGLEFEVNPSVLIPRPETEHVVEVALQRLGEREETAGVGLGTTARNIRIADVGTGSGCIAVALAKELPNAEIVATDISKAALEVARRNARRHNVADRIRSVETDLLESVLHESRITSRESRRFDLIVSNPPYVAREEAAALAREVREHEPGAALFGGRKGTEIYGRLLEQARALLVPGGILVLELGYDSAADVRSIVEKGAAWTRVEITNDLAGIPRVIAAERVESSF